MEALLDVDGVEGEEGGRPVRLAASCKPAWAWKVHIMRGVGLSHSHISMRHGKIVSFLNKFQTNSEHSELQLGCSGARGRLGCTECVFHLGQC